MGLMLLEVLSADRYSCSDPEPEPIDPDLIEHEAHAARGENHWFSCEWCDDEGDE